MDNSPANNEKNLAQFLTGYKSFLYKKHDIILSAGHCSQYIFFIVKGIVNEYLINAAGTSFTIDLLQENDFFPLFVFSDLSNMYYFQSYSAVEVKRIPKKDFISFLHDYPDILLEISKKMSTAAELIHDRLEHFLLSDCIEERLQYLVVQLAKRLVVRKKGKPLFLCM